MAGKMNLAPGLSARIVHALTTLQVAQPVRLSKLTCRFNLRKIKEKIKLDHPSSLLMQIDVKLESPRLSHSSSLSSSFLS
jgi:hypothetical protein